MFITELGRLLTFMTDADRQTALSFYTELFDSARDEDGLLRQLTSPTKQAVLLARSYSAPDKRLDGYGHGATAASTEQSSYMAKLEQIRADALAVGVIGALTENGPEADGAELFDKYTEEELAAAVPETVSAEAPAAESVPESADEPEGAAPSAETADAKTVTEPETATEAQSAETAAEAVVVPIVVPAPEADAATEAPPAEEGPAAEATASEPAPPAADDASAMPVFPAADAYDSLPEMNDDDYYAEEPEKVYRTKPLALIPYLILAIPVTLLGIALLLVPTMLSLALAGASMGLGALLLTAAFGTFSMLSDFLVVLGGAIILLAISLLFAWLFVWLIGGAVTALVRAVIRLGRKLCCEEVTVQ